MKPPESEFGISLSVRSDDLNYARHVSHQNYFTYFQEARIAYLKRLDFSELDICGYAMVIAEAACRYKKELFYGDPLRVTCRVASLKPKAFVMAYAIFKGDTLCAEGTTTNLCFDNSQKKVVALPQRFVEALMDFEGASLKAP